MSLREATWRNDRKAKKNGKCKKGEGRGGISKSEAQALKLQRVSNLLCIKTGLDEC